MVAIIRIEGGSEDPFVEQTHILRNDGCADNSVLPQLRKGVSIRTADAGTTIRFDEGQGPKYITLNNDGIQLKSRDGFEEVRLSRPGERVKLDYNAVSSLDVNKEPRLREVIHWDFVGQDKK